MVLRRGILLCNYADAGIGTAVKAAQLHSG
jgi:hypothetical protein